MKNHRWVLSLCFLVVACATSARPPLTARQKARLYLDIAVAAIQENDFSDALRRLFEAEAIDPAIPEIHHCKALAYLGKRDTVKALASARKAVELEPRFPDAQTTLGKILLDAGKLGEAELAFKKAIADPTFRQSFKARTSLGIISYRRGDYANAQLQFDRAIEEAPEAACAAHYYRGHLALQKSKYDQALRSYRRATQKFCGNFAEAHLAIGVALTRNRDYDQARKKFVEIVQLYPDSDVAEKAKERLRFIP